MTKTFEVKHETIDYDVIDVKSTQTIKTVNSIDTQDIFKDDANYFTEKTIFRR